MTEIEVQVIDLVARLPLVPISTLGPLVATSRAALYGTVRRLLERQIVVQFAAPPAGRGPRRQLLLLSDLGQAVWLHHREADSAELGERPIDAPSQRSLVRNLPSLLSLYELLRLVGAAGPSPATLDPWVRPWRFTVVRSLGEPGYRPHTLPAFVGLEWCVPNAGSIHGEYILVADTGGLSPAALRSQLAALARLAGLAERNVPEVVVATTSEQRAIAWQRMFDMGALWSLRATIATWAKWRGDPRHRPSLVRTTEPRASWLLDSRPWVTRARNKLPRLNRTCVEQGVS